MAFKNMTSSMFVQAVIVICGLILPRMLIEVYGSTVNGLVSTVKQMLTYFTVVSLGLGSASSVALYKPLANKDMDKINGILSATRVFFNRTGYIFATLISITAFILPSCVHEDINAVTITAIVIICGVGLFCEYTIVSKYKILLIADQKNYIVSRIIAQGVIINTIVSVILIKLNSSIVIVQIASTLAYMIRLLLMTHYIREKYPNVNFKATPDFNAIANRWEAFSYQISGMVITYTPIIIIALFRSFDDASIFSVYNMIYSSLAMIVAIFSAGFSASFGNVLAENNMKTLQKSYRTFEFVFRNVAFFCYTCALILTLSFVSVYVKNNDGVNYLLPMVSILFALKGLFTAMRTPSVTLVEAAGHFKENKWANIIEAIFNVVLSLLLVSPFGIAGILLAASITGLIRSIIYIIYACKYILKTNYLLTITKLVLNMALMILLYKLMNGMNCSNFIEWIYNAIFVGVICVGSFISLNTCLDFNAAKDSMLRVKMIMKK